MWRLNTGHVIGARSHTLHGSLTGILTVSHLSQDSCSSMEIFQGRVRCRLVHHQGAGNVHPGHFPIWLKLFDRVLAEELPADLAQSWSALAHRVGRGLSYGLTPKDAASAIPRLSLH